MEEREFLDYLALQIEETTDEELGTASTTYTYQEAGLLTHNQGLVIKLQDGSEFQLTLTKTK